MASAGLASLALIAMGGWDSRFDQTSLNYAKAAEDHSPVRSECITDRVTDHPATCTLGAASALPQAIVWGDSHAVEIAWVIGADFGEKGSALIQRTRGSCPPAIGYDPARDPRCAIFNANVVDEIAASDDIHTVYLAAYWAQDAYREANIDRDLSATISQLQELGKQVVLVGPIPSHPSSIPRRLALHGKDVPTPSVDDFANRTFWFTRNYPAWRAQGVTIIEPLERFSRDGATIIVAGDTPLYYDSHHLSIAGARYLLEGHSGG